MRGTHSRLHYFPTIPHDTLTAKSKLATEQQIKMEGIFYVKPRFLSPFPFYEKPVDYCC